MTSSHPHAEVRVATSPTFEAIKGLRTKRPESDKLSVVGEWFGDSGVTLPFWEAADTISYQFIHPPLPMEAYRDDDGRWVAAHYDAKKYCHRWLALGSGKDAVRCHIGAVSLKALRSVGVHSYSTKSTCQRAIRKTLMKGFKKGPT